MTKAHTFSANAAHHNRNNHNRHHVDQDDDNDDEEANPYQIDETSDTVDTVMTKLDNKLAAERMAKSSLILNYLLESNKKLTESKSCNVFSDVDLTAASNNNATVGSHYPQQHYHHNHHAYKVPNNDTMHVFDDKQLVTEEQFNQAFILNVSSAA